jgi:precorrin-3B methylase
VAITEIRELLNAGFGVVIYNTNASDLRGLLEATGPNDNPCALAQDVFRPEERVIITRASKLAFEVAGFMERRATLILTGPRSYIKDGMIITRRGYDTKYSY